MTREQYEVERKERRERMIKMISEAHVDAGRAPNSYGWIKVDCYGSLTRVDPETITEKKKKGKKV